MPISTVRQNLPLIKYTNCKNELIKRAKERKRDKERKREGEAINNLNHVNIIVECKTWSRIASHRRQPTNEYLLYLRSVLYGRLVTIAHFIPEEAESRRKTKEVTELGERREARVRWSNSMRGRFGSPIFGPEHFRPSSDVCRRASNCPCKFQF